MVLHILSKLWKYCFPEENESFGGAIDKFGVIGD